MSDLTACPFCRQMFSLGEAKACPDCGLGLEDLHKHLLVNGQGMAALSAITKMMAHLPLAALDRPPRDAIVVALGMGTTFRSLVSWGVRATAVELVPSVHVVAVAGDVVVKLYQPASGDGAGSFGTETAALRRL